MADQTDSLDRRKRTLIAIEKFLYLMMGLRWAFDVVLHAINHTKLSGDDLAIIIVCTPKAFYS